MNPYQYTEAKEVQAGRWDWFSSIVFASLSVFAVFAVTFGGWGVYVTFHALGQGSPWAFVQLLFAGGILGVGLHLSMALLYVLWRVVTDPPVVKSE